MPGTAWLPALTILFSSALLAVLVARRLWRQTRSQRRGVRRRLAWAASAGVWGVTVVWIHFAFPQQHRLYFDEDVYANMARNILDGHGDSVTLIRTGEVKAVERYKWPGGFPALAMPLVLLAGPERGPAYLNEACGALTIALLMVLAVRLSGTVLAAPAVALLYGLHPLVGGWYRAGSAEPLALLFLMLALWASVEGRLRPRPQGDWLAIAVLAALLAVHTRLESVLVAIPLLLLLLAKGRAPLLSRSWWSLLPGFGAVSLLALSLHHSTRLASYYLVDDPTSSFGFSYLLANLESNFGLVVELGPWPLVLLAAAVLVVAATPKQERRHVDLVSGAIAAWLVSYGVVLLLYSAGRLTAPGGSRFLLLPIALLALAATAGLGMITNPKARAVVTAAGLVCCFSQLPTPSETWRILDQGTASPRREHEAVRQWAHALPERAVVRSRMPYLWENFDTFTAHHDVRRPGRIRSDGRLYYHFGLLDLSRLQQPSSSFLVDEVLTEHGSVSLLEAVISQP